MSQGQGWSLRQASTLQAATSSKQKTSIINTTASVPIEILPLLHRIVQHLSNHGLSIPNPIGSSKYITGPKTIYTERVDLDVLKPSKLDCRGRVIGTWSQVGVCLATLSKRESHLVQRGPLWGRGRENSMYFSASWVIYLAIIFT